MAVLACKVGFSSTIGSPLLLLLLLLLEYNVAQVLGFGFNGPYGLLLLLLGV